MPNNKALNVKKNKVKPCKEVVFIKFIILIVVLLIPIIYIVLNLTSSFNLNKKSPQNLNLNESKTSNLQATQPAKEVNFHFNAPLPSNRTGDISKVSKEKIDSLFNNLKE